MNDTQILDRLRDKLKDMHNDHLPLSPLAAGRWVEFIAGCRADQRKQPLDADLDVETKTATWEHSPKDPPFQHYWRCNHYPIAIENFFRGRPQCACTDKHTGPSNGFDYGLYTDGRQWKCSEPGCYLTGVHGHTGEIR